jgi:hypothetical protein
MDSAGPATNNSTATNGADGANTQQQVQSPTQAPATATASVAGDQLTCQWTNCGERCVTAEQLYVSDSFSIVSLLRFSVFWYDCICLGVRT